METIIPKKKKDLTSEEYYNPDSPTYKIGNIGLDILSRNAWLMKIPYLRDKIKDEAYRIGSQGQSSFRTLEDIDVKNKDKYKSLPKYTGIVPEGNTNVGNVDLLKQYIYGNQGLKESKFTPKDDYLGFLPSYSLKEKLGISGTSNYLSAMQKNPINAQQLKDLESVIKTHKPVFYSDNTKSPNLETKLFYDKEPNLGHYKSGFGYDEKVGLPYASISDAWDFYPKDYAKAWGETVMDSKGNTISNAKNTQEYQQSYLMHKVGEPFKIYDRVYIDPITKKPISDEEILAMKASKAIPLSEIEKTALQSLKNSSDNTRNPNILNMIKSMKKNEK